MEKGINASCLALTKCANFGHIIIGRGRANALDFSRIKDAPLTHRAGFGSRRSASYGLGKALVVSSSCP